jgi:hypothetical protein
MSLRWLRQCSKTNEVDNDECIHWEGLAGTDSEIQGHWFLLTAFILLFLEGALQGVFNQL